VSSILDALQKLEAARAKAGHDLATPVTPARGRLPILATGIAVAFAAGAGAALWLRRPPATPMVETAKAPDVPPAAAALIPAAAQTPPMPTPTPAVAPAPPSAPMPIAAATAPPTPTPVPVPAPPALAPVAAAVPAVAPTPPAVAPPPVVATAAVGQHAAVPAEAPVPPRAAATSERTGVAREAARKPAPPPADVEVRPLVEDVAVEPDGRGILPPPAGAPRIRVSFLAYSPAPERRSVSLSIDDATMVTLHEGESSGGIEVATILTDRVQLRHQGRLFTVLARD
jgi:hypothetical protein